MWTVPVLIHVRVRVHILGDPQECSAEERYISHENGHTCSPLTLWIVPELVHVRVWVHTLGDPSECSAEERYNHQQQETHMQDPGAAPVRNQDFEARLLGA